ncbi:MAG: hypothetical protein NZ840_01605 [Anaerolineales bacterium]|nr:hypothetical protein [Anaerolineales bacterium]MDW8160732.1 hypothetical protein [Anaerolineales bacterium]
MKPQSDLASSMQPTFRLRNYLPISLVLMTVGWGGLAYLVFFTLPTLGMRWLFYFFAVLAFTGTALPIIAFLHLRFPGKNPTPIGSIVRQALWVGIYFPVLAWLQIARVLTLGLAIFIALCLFIIEVSLTLRERSLWSTSQKESE